MSQKDSTEEMRDREAFIAKIRKDRKELRISREFFFFCNKGVRGIVTSHLSSYSFSVHLNGNDFYSTFLNIIFILSSPELK